MITANKFTDSLGKKLKRSWKVTKQTFHVMRLDKEIMVLPILSSISSIFLFFIFVFPFFLALLAPTGQEKFMFIYVGIFAFYFLVTFIAVFFNAAIVHIAKTRFQGGDATLKEGLSAAWGKKGKLAQWSLLSATVGLLLNILSSQAREKKGIVGMISRLIISLVGLAWAIVTLFVVPSIVMKGHGPIDAIKSSVKTIKKTWGESLVKYYGISAIRALFVWIGIFVFAVPGAYFMITQPFALGAVLIAIFIVYVMLVSVIFSSANTIFDTALFIYADTGKVPEFYTKEEFEHAFVRTH